MESILCWGNRQLNPGQFSCINSGHTCRVLTQRAEEKPCGGNYKSEPQGQRQEMQERESVPFYVASFKWNKTVRRVWSSDLAGKLEMVFK